ncbi:MAG: TetR/AcrR family transcriptional regulator [Nocardioides sp.]|nr:TetR/AcrR family transcriptional regulator [Nocardioides sp.]
METDLAAPDQTVPSGRPRDPRIDRAVLRAAAELVVEQGYADVTIAAIAERAGTTKPSVYRRWPSKAHLVHEAVFPTQTSTSLPHTGTLAGDVREMLRRTAAAFAEPAARAAIPGLLAAIAAEPTLHTALLERFQDGVWGALHDRLVEAVDAGEVRPGLDPGALLEVIAGASLMALLIRSTDQLDEAWVGHTADLLTKGIAP